MKVYSYFSYCYHLLFSSRRPRYAQRDSRILPTSRRVIFPLILLFFIANNASAQSIVTKHLYLSDPSQALDRIDPVATNDATTALTNTISTTAPGVAVDVLTTSYASNPGATTFTVAHTTGTGYARLMLVGISDKNKLVTSVTYGGVPLTLVGEDVGSGNAHIHLYYLLNPTSGAANVVVTMSANPDKGIVIGVATFTGVNQTTPFGTFTSAHGNSNTATTTVSSAAGELVYDVLSYRNSTATANASQTVKYNINTGGELKAGGASTKPGAASVAMTWTGSGSTDWAIGAVPIKPAPALSLISFTQSPVLCSPLTIKASNTITITNYVSIISGSMPANPAITATLKYGSTTIATFNSPVYNSGTGIITWSGTIGSDVTVPSGSAIVLEINCTQASVGYKINYDSQTKPSKVSLPVSTFIHMNSVNVYDAAYPAGNIITGSVGGTTKYIRAVVTDPFGASDITATDVTITPTGSTYSAPLVNTSGCTKTFEYVWSVPGTAGTYSITATAKEGYENTVTHSANTSISVCVDCPPSAINDTASGPSGVPITVNVLLNDSDPNNNLNAASLTVITQPNNGSAVVYNGKIVYIPNGTFSGNDTLRYQVCDNSSPTPICATAYVYLTIDPATSDACALAPRTTTYYIPYPEQDAYAALQASSAFALASNNIRTIISIKIPYPGIVITWDEWEDGYESNINNPTQSTTKIWGDGDPYNGIAPGYPNDIIPAGGFITLDNTMPANPRNSANFFYDGRDKVMSNAQLALTQVCGEPSNIGLQVIKTNITSTYDFGQSFTVPFGQDFNSRDFYYTSLFVRAAENNTTINIDKDNNGTFETTTTLNEGNIYFVNGGVMTGATVTSDKPIGVELHSGGVDNWSVRNSPIFPATWYSNTYYTPVPTSDNSGDNPKDSSAVMLYNSLNRSITVNWSSGAPASGSIAIPAKSVVRFPLAYSTTAAYKFVNPTGESFTAIEIVDSYTPGGGGNSGTDYDWAFNLISEAKLSDFATIAWAPGGLDQSAPPGPDVNGNPIWVTPNVNTTLYVKYDGLITGSTGSTSPCGLKYDVSYNVNALNYVKIKDPNDNDQSGIAVYTCNGAKIAAVYGEDPTGASIANPYLDVGTTIQPFCKTKMVFANDDFVKTLLNQPVTISVLGNDWGFLAVLDQNTLNTTGLLQPHHGSVAVNSNGTILYIPNNGFVGIDTFEYQICSTPAVVCDIAKVYVQITTCPSGNNQNIISGQVFLDKTKDGINNDGGVAFYPAKVYLYADGNCNGSVDAGELTDSVTVDASGTYQFVRYPEKTVFDNFDATAGTSSCASGSDGNTAWATNWVDAGEGGSTGYCVTPAQSNNNTDAEMVVDQGDYALRLDDNNVSATRTFNTSGATKSFLTFSYRRGVTNLATGEDVYVQVSPDGTNFTTIFTITGDGTTDASYVTVYNQDITAYASATTYLRFLTNNAVDEGDYVYIDSIQIRFIKYNQCYIVKLDPNSTPYGYYNTTVTSRNVTFTSGATCNGGFDFGITKSSVAISGTVHNDNNALQDNNINGPGLGNPDGVQLYAYLIDSLGKIAFKSTVTAGSGDFSFPNADATTTYSLKLSTIDSALFKSAPSSANFPGLWGSTGDGYGNNNQAGSGIEAGNPNSVIAVKTGISNITGIEFGIERIPNSDDKFTTIPHPWMNQIITLNGGVNPPILSGSDGEDCPSGCNLTNKKVVIDAYPTNADLLYNNVMVDDGDTISNFNPSLLQIRITTATLGDTTIIFNYSFVDQAIKKDPSPAYYKLYWPVPLPATGLTLTADLAGSLVSLKWMTLSEQNTSHFILERSIDNLNYTVIAGNIPAAGESISRTDYSSNDNIEALRGASVIYYRVRLVDIDGHFKYSNVAAVRLTGASFVSAWPNPFQSTISVNIYSVGSSVVAIRLNDANGRTVMTRTERISNGMNQLNIPNLQHLPSGTYMLEITDINTGVKSVEKLNKIH